MDSVTQNEQRTRIRLADEALENRDYIRALRYYRDAVQNEPYNQRILINLGFCYARTNNYTEAKRCFETALQVEPDNRVAKQNLSRINTVRQKKRKGTGRIAPRIPPEELVFIRYMQWGSELIKKGNYYSALQFFREASGIHPDFVEPYKRIGYCFAKLHNYKEAVLAFEDALLIFPDDPVALDCLERCKDRMVGDYRGSIPQKPELPVYEAAPEPVPIPFIAMEPDETEETTLSPVPQEESDFEIFPVDTDIGDKDSLPLESAEAVPPEVEAAVPASIEVAEIPAPEPVQEEEKPKPAMSDDDLIAAILSQYADEIPAEKPAEEQEPSPEEKIDGGVVPDERDRDEQQTQETVPRENNKERHYVELTDDQMDALRELGNIGASHAATTLSTMLNTPIMMNVPEISINDIGIVNTKLEQEDAALVYFRMEGEISDAGYVVLHVPKESVIQMTSIMLGLPPDLSRNLDEMDESALNEIGNIMVSAFLDGTAELLGIIMLPSPPRILFDKPEKLFALIIEESNISYQSVVFFKTEMQCDEYELTCNILMLPNPPVLHEIIRMLEKLIEDSLEQSS
ncbi:MAG: tetratricopeptide repeat protein [Methanospirillaceae archaeon]|nr:tetratricopeptide repeat protein [Methanospirillaceae archaeon]